jgi:hypothetical protein
VASRADPLPVAAPAPDRAAPAPDHAAPAPDHAAPAPDHAAPAPRIPADTLPAAPSLRHAIRRSLGDAYYHSWRLLPANVVWAVALIGVAVALIASTLALVLVPLLALPTAGMFRIATRIVRGESVSFWDAIDAWRTEVRATLLVGAAVAVAAITFFSNVVTGLSSASPLGWVLATLAAWGLVALWLLGWALWPILVDPWRADRPATDRARLAALLVLAHPFRIAALAIVLTAFLALSTVAIVALVTISMSLAALVASRFVLPAADRLEADLAARTAASATTIATTTEGSTAVSSER